MKTRVSTDEMGEKARHLFNEMIRKIVCDLRVTDKVFPNHASAALAVAAAAAEEAEGSSYEMPPVVEAMIAAAAALQAVPLTRAVALVREGRSGAFSEEWWATVLVGSVTLSASNSMNPGFIEL
jgi:hypothetical protein